MNIAVQKNHFRGQFCTEVWTRLKNGVKERFRAKMENGNQNGKNKTTQSEQHITKQYQRPITMARGFAMTTTRWQSGSIYRLNDCNSMPAGLDKGKQNWATQKFVVENYGDSV